MRILHLEPKRYPQEAKERLEALGPVAWVDCYDQAEMMKLATTTPYEVVFVKLGLAFDADFFQACPSLKYLVTPTTGLNHIDLAAAEDHGVTVLSLKGEVALLDTIKSTAEHTWALLLMLIRNLQGATAHVEQGGWQREPFLAGELDGKVLGLLGLGRLGRIVAGYGYVFGMHVQAYDTDPTAFDRCPHPVESVDLNELFATSDVVSIHIPSVPETRQFVNASLLQVMPPHAVLINTARGEVVDESALLAALKGGTLAGAAVDVLDGDSAWSDTLVPGHPLVAYAATHPNLLITPHMGGYGKESIERTRVFMVEKLVKALPNAD